MENDALNVVEPMSLYPDAVRGAMDSIVRQNEDEAARMKIARKIAAAQLLRQTDYRQLDDAGRTALFRSCASNMAGMNVMEPQEMFGRRAVADMAGNLDLLRRFADGEWQLVEDPDAEEWQAKKAEGEEAAAKFADEKLGGAQEYKEMMGDLPALAGAGMPGAQFGNFMQNAAAPNREDTIRRHSGYDSLTDEEKAEWRRNRIEAYDRKMAIGSPVATFLKMTGGLDDNAKHLVEKAWRTGELTRDDLKGYDETAKRQILGAVDLMRGDQKTGTLLLVPGVDVSENGFKANLYAFQQSILGLPGEVVDTATDIFRWTAAARLSGSEREEAFKRLDEDAAIKAALKQPLAEPESFLGAMARGVAENLWFLLPSVSGAKGLQMMRTAQGLKPVAEGGKVANFFSNLGVTLTPWRAGRVAKEAVKQADKAVEAAKVAVLSKAVGTARVTALSKKVDFEVSQMAVRRQMAAMQRYTEALRNAEALRGAAAAKVPGQVAKWWGGAAVRAASATAMFSSFFREYVDAADAAGISREESVPTGLFVGYVNDMVERIYVPGLEGGNLAASEIKFHMLGSAAQAVRKMGGEGLKRWAEKTAERFLATTAKTVATESGIEEPTQQLMTEFGLALNRRQEQLRKDGQGDVATAIADIWQKATADGVAQKVFDTYCDAAWESLPGSIGLGILDMPIASLRQRRRNWWNSRDEGLADAIQRGVDALTTTREYWTRRGDDAAGNPNAFQEAMTAARQAFRAPQTRDVVGEVAKAAGVDVKTAEVITQYLRVEADMELVSPKFSSWASQNMSLADINEESIKTVMPGYVEGSFAADPEQGVYSGKVRLGDGTERTIAYRIGDWSEIAAAQVEENAKVGSSLGKSFDAQMKAEGRPERWAELSEAERYYAAVRGVKGWSSGAGGVFELTDGKGEKVRVNADDIIYLATGRLADIGYGAAATQGTARHETFHSLWRFARASMKDEDVQALAKTLGIDVTQDDWENDLDEAMAVQMEQYASGHYVAHAISSRFDKMIDGWAGKVINFFGKFGQQDEVMDPNTGKPYALKGLYDKILRGEIGSGALGVELRKVPAQPSEASAKTEGATKSTIPVEVTDADRAAQEAEMRQGVDETSSGNKKLVQQNTAQNQAKTASVDENGIANAKLVQSSVPVATSENPADAATPNQRYYRVGLPNSNVKLVGRLEVRDAETGLVTSTDEDYHDRGNQNRDDRSEESRALVEKIGAKPDPLQVGTVQPMANNGVVWALPNGDVVIGNHCVNGVRLGYEKGTAAELEKFVREDAAKRGIEIGEDVKKPILVFVLERIESPDDKTDIHEVVRLANESQNRGFNVREQAANDAKILLDNNLLPRMAFRADGRIDETKSGDAIGRFRQESGAQGMIAEDGSLTEEGQTRIQNAALAALLGEGENAALLQKVMANAKRLDMQNELRALMKATPELMALAAEKPAYDLRQPLAEALQLFTEWRDKDEELRLEKGKTRHDWRKKDKDGKRIRGLSWEAFMSQGDMFRKPSEEARILGDLLAAAEAERSFDREDVESAVGKKRAIDLVANYLADYVENARAVNTETEDMFGGTPASRAEVMAAQRGNPAGGVRFSISGIYTGSAADYDKPSVKYIGTGEGNQVYGWGLYGSTERGVAESYSSLSSGAYLKNEKPITDFFERTVAEKLDDFGGDVAKAIVGLSEQSKNLGPSARKETNAIIRELKQHGQEYRRKGGSVYEQTFFTNREPGDESHLLKWYEPVSEEQLKWIRETAEKEDVLDDRFKQFLDVSKRRINGEAGDKANGDSLYMHTQWALGSPKAASEFLYRAGIDGVKYPVDSYGKTVKDGDEAGWDYVAFSDEHIRVDHKWTDGQQRFSIATPYDPRSRVPAVRGGWNEKKILRYLKANPSLHGITMAARLISEFDTVEELKEHMFYHGTKNFVGSMQPSMVKSERWAQEHGGGGYGQRYWGISVSKSKKIASNFGNPSPGVSIYPVVLAKGAKVVDRPDLVDAADVEDHIVELWNDGVDAVRLSDWNSDTSEQELLVLNPRAICNIGTSDYYRYFQLGSEENPLDIKDDAHIARMLEAAKEYADYKPSRQFGKPMQPSMFQDGTNELKPKEVRDAEREQYEKDIAAWRESEQGIAAAEYEREMRDTIRFSVGTPEGLADAMRRRAEERYAKELPLIAKTKDANPLVTADDFDEKKGGALRFSVSYGKGRQEEMARLIGKYRPDIADPREAVAELIKFDTNAECNAAFRWLCENTIKLPQDEQIVKDAVATAARAKVDPAKYSRPGEVLEQFAKYRPKAKAIDPETVPELTDRRDDGGGVVSYQVADTRGGQAAMRRIIDTHWGEDANPWCLLARQHRDEQLTPEFWDYMLKEHGGNLLEAKNNFAASPKSWRAQYERETGKKATFIPDQLENAWQYWNHYNALPKRVAFKNGKLLAFMATETMDESQAFDDAAFGGASRLAQMYPEEYREYENALETDEEVQENQPNFYEWLQHDDEYYKLTTEEGLREHTPEEWWDRKDESHIGPNALREIAGEPRFSVATAAPRTQIAYPQLRDMTDDELLAAAFAARMALGASEKFSDRAVKISSVQKMMRRLHPDWDTTDIGRESNRILSNARKLGQMLRGDIERGVSESLVLKHLPARVHEQFGREMREEARRGQRLGVFGARVVGEIERRQDEIAADAVRVQTGIDANAIESAYGINLSETMMRLVANPLAEREESKPPVATGGGADNKGSASAGQPDDSAAEKEVDAKVKATVDAIVGAAKTATELDRRNRENMRNAAGREAERDGETAGGGGSESGGSASGGGDTLYAAVKKSGLDLESPRHLARFVAELARRQWIKEHGLAADAEVWRDLVAVQFLRKTAQSVYAKLCRDLTYSRGRETAMSHIEKFDSVPTVRGLISEMEFVGALINARRIRETQKAKCEKLDLFLREKFGAQGRFKPDKEEGKRSVSAEAELRARDMREVMWLTPDAAAEEARKLQETLNALSVDFKDAGRDVDQSRAFVKTLRKLNILREFGALRYRPIGEIDAAAQWWEDYARGEGDEIVREMYDREIRTTKAAHLLAVAFADPKRKTVREGGKADALNRYITGHMGFLSLLRDCMRFASDADAAAANDILEYIDLEIQKSGDRTEAEKRRHNDAFVRAVESIYGAGFNTVMKEMAAPDERFAKFMGEVGGKRVQATKGRALQLLVSLLQEGRKVEVEDEDNPGHTKTVWIDGYHDNIVKHHREGQAAEIMRLLTPADMNMLKWLGQWYEQNRGELSEVCRSLFGIGVYAELPNYFPVKMLLEKQGLEKGEAVGWTIFPKALTPRVKNERDFDTSMDIFSMWASRMEEAAQWKHHAQLGLEMRGIFGRAELQASVIANHGKSINALMQGFITDILAGHGAYDRSTAGVEYFSDQIRGWTALCALGGNLGVMLKQTTSIPAFGFEIGLVNTAKYMVNAFTPEGMEAMRRIWNSEQRQTRWQVGSSEVIRNALSQNGAGALKRMFQASMITTKVGDVVPALVVGQGIYRDCLESGMSKDDAMAKTWSIIERTQQSGRMENQTSVQRRNKLGRIMFQFLSTQQQYLQYEARAIRDVIARPDSVKRWGALGRALVLNHFILSSAYFWMGELYKACLGQEPPDDELKDWMITCLLGPYGSLMVAGFCCKATLERAIKGYSLRSPSMLPMEQWIKTQTNDGMRLVEAIFDSEGDTWDELLDAAGRWMSDVNSTVRDLRKLYRFRVKGEQQRR